MKSLDPGLREFAWHDGYGAFSVSKSEIHKIKAYIANQEEHHRKQTYLEEIVSILKENGVEFDERYFWD